MLVKRLTISIVTKMRHSRGVKANAGDVLQPAACAAVIAIELFRDL
jgi:hypothetical protein